MLARIIRRLKKSTSVDEIILATCDKECVEIAQHEQISWYIGEQDDVLARFYHAAKNCGTTIVVRITADCPCVDPATVDKLVEYYIENGWELVYNRNDNLAYCSEIDGLDVEVFSFNALEAAYNQAQDPNDREHVTRWMYNNLRSIAVESGWHIDKPEELKLSVDTKEDYERICKIYEALGPDFGTKELIKYFGKKDLQNNRTGLSIA